MVLDEATSSVDSYSEQLIQDATDKITKGRTSIVIAHRLATIKKADRILVMDAGKIVEQSKVDELYENPKHPYTIALLNSTPDLNDNTNTKLDSIDGYPPDMTKIIKGCSFYERCVFKIDKCNNIPPEIRKISEQHQIACHINI